MDVQGVSRAFKRTNKSLYLAHQTSLGPTAHAVHTRTLEFRGADSVLEICSNGTGQPTMASYETAQKGENDDKSQG